MRKRVVGQGTFGRVVVCEEKCTGRRAALKLFDDADGTEARVEINNYRKMAAMGGHPSILPMLDADPSPPTPWIALPLVPGGSLSQVLMAADDTTLPSQARHGLVVQMVGAVAWLHSSKMAHLDIKPKNMLLDQLRMTLFLCDFGSTVSTDEDGRITPDQGGELCNGGEGGVAGVTAHYRAPELWKAPLTLSTRCFPVDVFALGCSVSEVFSGRPLMDSMGHGPCSSTQDVRRRMEDWCGAWRRRRGTALVELLQTPSHLRGLVWWACSPHPSDRPQLLHMDVRFGWQGAPVPMLT
ncbi:MAG: protein kinase [Pseudomonadota bacterium]